jgi:hypothetical protein
MSPPSLRSRWNCPTPRGVPAFPIHGSPAASMMMACLGISSKLLGGLHLRFAVKVHAPRLARSPHSFEERHRDGPRFDRWHTSGP